jgi:hypothetical protein
LPRRARYDWKILADTLLSLQPLTWVRVDLAALPGDTNQGKRMNVYSNMNYRKVKVQTTIDGSAIFVRHTPTTEPLQ